MKKPIVAVIGMTVALTMLSGCSKDEVEETIQPLVADAIEVRILRQRQWRMEMRVL